MMTLTKRISQYDIVELVEPVGEMPVGARGGVLDVLDGSMAMVEITSVGVDADRLVVAPLAGLRVVDPAPHRR